MRQSLFEQLIAQITGAFNCMEFDFLAKKHLLIHQKTSDYLAGCYVTLIDGLLDLELLDKI